MKKNCRLFALLLAGGLAAATFSAAGPAQTPADRVGFQLLDRLVALLSRTATSGPGGEDFGQNILLLAKDMNAAREAKLVDDIFAVRFGRLLSVVRQALLRDPEVLYWPMYRFTMAGFIEERTGQMPDWDNLLFVVNDHGGSGVGLAVISDAVMSEVVSLHIHLETLARRPEILRSYLERSRNALVALK